MDAKKVLEVIDTYREHFREMNIPQSDFPHKLIVTDKEQALAHCHGMLDKMEKLVKEGRIEKAFRWLGLIQGWLWSTGQFPLEDLKNHNRPDSSD